MWNFGWIKSLLDPFQTFLAPTKKAWRCCSFVFFGCPLDIAELLTPSSSEYIFSGTSPQLTSLLSLLRSLTRHHTSAWVKTCFKFHDPNLMACLKVYLSKTYYQRRFAQIYGTTSSNFRFWFTSMEMTVVHSGNPFKQNEYRLCSDHFLTMIQTFGNTPKV